MDNGKIITWASALQTPADPEVITAAVDEYLEEHPLGIDDTAGEGDTDKVWSADKTAGEVATLSEAIVPLQGGIVSPEQFGAVGDGETDDSQAVQDAVDAGYDVRFADNKTYYLASPVTIDHDCHLFGGKNTVIKTATPNEGIANEAFQISGTLKKTTTLTSDYTIDGETANVGDKFVLTDMTGVAIGDIMEIVAEDQWYSYCRDYYYLGGVLLVSDVTENAIFTCDALPFDIDNSEDVSVKVYSAPQVVMENLKFISDHDSAGEYVYAVRLDHCKNSTVKNCTVTDADNGIYIGHSVNTFVDCVTVANMPLSGTGRALDHYGIGIYSCTNTTIQRVMGNAANSCIDMGGTFPNLNTRIKDCNLFALSRHDGMGMHENAYNTVFEDCVIGGLLCFGTVYVNRCKFVHSFRNNQKEGINFRGSHNPNHGRLVVENCVFDDTVAIQIPTPYTQDNPQAFDHVIDEIIVKNCQGGFLQFTPSTTTYILSNRIKRLTLQNWHNCYEIYHTENGIIDEMIVENCTFTNRIWINDHNGVLKTDGIRVLRWKNDCDQTDKMYVDIKKYGGRFYMQSGVPVNCSSSTQTDRYQVCGKNISSNKPADYGIGSVNGWEGNSISFSPDGRFSSALSVDANGDLVFTQPNNTNKVSIYPLCLVYVPNGKRIKMSCVLKNTGATTGPEFRPYLAVVDCATGLINYRNNNSTVQATADGAEATHERLIDTGDSLVLWFLYCCTPVAGSETTLSNFVAQVVSDDFPEMVFEPYDGSSRVGDGSLQSVDGMNNILVNATGAFDVKFKVDLLDK